MSNLNCITYIKFSRFFGDLSIYLVICCLPKEENVVIRVHLFYEEDSNLFFLLEECPLYNPFVSVGVFIKPNKVATGGFEWRVVDVAFWSPTGCQLWWSLDSDLM